MTDDPLAGPRLLDSHPVHGSGVPPIMEHFAFDHLPPKLAAVSAWFCTVANDVATVLPAGPEQSVALRKLLEAKDAAVRAARALP